MRLEIDGVQRVLRPEALVVIGYAGRDRAAVEAHISELAELGVPRPASVPLFMAFPPRLICQAPRVEAAGGHTSGEAEVVLAVDGDDVFVTVGSDHTDRALEAVDIVASKGVCPKPVATKGWPAAALNGRWDGLRLRSRIDDGVLYQDGPVSANVAPTELVAAIPWRDAPPRCFVAFTGTVGVIGEIRPSRVFQAELSCPGLAALTLRYETLQIAPLAAAP